MHLLLVRHGQSENNALELAHVSDEEYNKLRSPDPSLSALGFEQAELLGKHLGAQLRCVREKVHVFASSMTRAFETAAPLARALGAQLTVLPRLHEVKGFKDFNLKDGAAEAPRGLGRLQLMAACPGCDADSVPDEGEGSETPVEAAKRVASIAAMLKDWAKGKYRGQVVVIVAHGEFNSLLASHLLAEPPVVPEKLKSHTELFTTCYLPMNNAGVSHFAIGTESPPGYYPATTFLLYWNRSDHLPESLRSGLNFRPTGISDAAVWARLGESCSGLPPLFVESDTMYFGHRRRYDVAVAAFCAGLLLAATAAAALGRRRQ